MMRLRRLAFCLLFDPLTGVSGGWYLPLGIGLRFPTYRFGLLFQELFPLNDPLGAGVAAAAIEAYLPIGTVGESLFGLSVEVGAAVFWNRSSQPLFLIDMAPGFRYEYRVKTYS